MNTEFPKLRLRCCARACLAPRLLLRLSSAELYAASKSSIPKGQSCLPKLELVLKGDRILRASEHMMQAR